MRFSLTPRTSEFFELFARSGENALEVARLVERRFREHPNSGVTQEQVAKECGWPLRFAGDLAETPAPTDNELGVLRALHERTRRAHGGQDA